MCQNRWTCMFFEYMKHHPEDREKVAVKKRDGAAPALRRFCAFINPRPRIRRIRLG